MLKAKTKTITREQQEQIDQAAIIAIDRASHETKQAIALTAESPPESHVAHLGELGSQALIKYCTAAANHLRNVAQELLNFVDSECQQALLLAADLERLAGLESKRIINMTDKARVMAQTMSSLREEFMRPIAEIEAPVANTPATNTTISPPTADLVEQAPPAA